MFFIRCLDVKSDPLRAGLNLQYCTGAKIHALYKFSSSSRVIKGLEKMLSFQTPCSRNQIYDALSDAGGLLYEDDWSAALEARTQPCSWNSVFPLGRSPKLHACNVHDPITVITVLQWQQLKNQNWSQGVSLTWWWSKQRRGNCH